MNIDWPRWIKASVNVAFNQDIAILQSFPLFIEGTDRRTEDLEEYSELRIDGPHITELSKGYWQVDVTIDVLIQIKKNNEDIYRFDRAIGNVLAAFKNQISVLQLGDGLNDNPMTLLGCLVLLAPKGQNAIIVTNFGQPDITVRTSQATVEASYRMYLTT